MYICAKCDVMIDEDWADGLARKEAEATASSLVDDLFKLKPPPNDPGFEEHFRKGCLDAVIEKCENYCDDCFIRVQATTPLRVPMVIRIIENAVDEYSTSLAHLIMLAPPEFRTEIADTYIPALVSFTKGHLGKLGGIDPTDAGGALVTEIRRLIGNITADPKMDDERKKAAEVLGQAADEAFERMKEAIKEAEDEEAKGEDPK